MLRLLGLAVLLVGMSAPMAMAVDYSKVSCSNPRFQHYMVTRLPKLTSMVSGGSFAARFTNEQVLSARTISAAPDKIICELSVALTSRGTTRTLRGQFTTMATPHGARWKWLPGY